MLWILTCAKFKGLPLPANSHHQSSSSCRGLSVPWVVYPESVEGIDKTHPEIAIFWHPTLNGQLSPSDVSKGSDKRVYWLCKKGHEYQSRVKDRIKANGCVVCSNRKVIPGVNDLVTLYPELAAQWHPLKNGRKDPTKSLGGQSKIWWKCDLGHEWAVTVWSRVYFKTGCPVCSNQVPWSGFNDLLTTHPELATQWHSTKNGKLKPSEILAGSPRKIWWKCDLGHEWEAACSSRALMGVGCPVCSNKQIVSGVNDLASRHPEVSRQWDFEKNFPVTPDKVAPATSKSFWWICGEGHSWKASISSRTTKNSDCPFCGGQRAIPGKTDLATTHPYLVAEWHPTRNHGLNPTEVMAGTDKKVWWLCPKGHEWSAPPYNRKIGVGCPSCAKTGYSPSENGYIYLLSKFNEQLQQFGISNFPEDRLRVHKKNGWQVLDVLGPADGVWVAETEAALKEFFRKKGILLARDGTNRFDGYTETWDSQHVRYDSIQALLEELRSSEWEK